SDLPTMLQYRTHSKNDSMYNTPPTFAIYLIGLVLKWIKSSGGLAAMEQRNRAKAERLYAFLDQSRLFKPTADSDSRSLMNVTFVTGNEELDNKFVKVATAAGPDGLKGHRSVGGKGELRYVKEVPVLIVRGSHAEMGEQIGNLALKPAAKIVDLVNEYANQHVPKGVRPIADIAVKAMYDKFPKEYRNELEAMAAA